MSFELIGVEEGRYFIETEEEKVTIKIVPIVLNVVEEEGKVGKYALKYVEAKGHKGGGKNFFTFQKSTVQLGSNTCVCLYNSILYNYVLWSNIG